MKFSIVVPTRYREPDLEELLTALVALETPREVFEVWIVDDGSQPPPEALVARYADRLPVELLARPHSGPAATRNAGAAAARGEWIAFTDDDCRPCRGWLEAFRRAAREHPTALLGGRVVAADPTNPYLAAATAVADAFLEVENADPHAPRFFASNDFAVPTAIFRDLGGFDAVFDRAAGEDRDLCDRWRAAGHPLVGVPEAVVEHTRPRDLVTFLRQQARYGIGSRHVATARANRGQPAALAGRGVLQGLARRAVRGDASVARPIWAALLALSQLAMIVGRSSPGPDYEGR